ncbi:MAG: glycosyltransferase [Tamlana sp.]
MILSIIIPLYNVEDHVETCIVSLLNQNLSLDEYEILVINDGSTDNSVGVVKKIMENNSNINIINQKNCGVGSARNKGLSMARGKYIYFIDPDDYLASNVLRPLLNCIEANDLEILTFSSLNTTQKSLIKSSLKSPKKIDINSISGFDYIAEYGYKNEVWWYIIKKSFIDNNSFKFIEGRWMEDAIFTVNLILNAKKIASLPIDAHRHVIVKGSAIKSREPKHYIKVIHDNANAAKVYAGFINEIEDKENIKPDCLKRLKARQQSFVFFLMIRALKSKMKLKEVNAILRDMTKVNAYPLHNFIGKDYNGFVNKFIKSVFNIKSFYFLIFLILNPLLRLVKE